MRESDRERESQLRVSDRERGRERVRLKHTNRLR